jgi:hypothetical protein
MCPVTDDAPHSTETSRRVGAKLRFAAKAALSLAVLYVGWATAAVCLEGWRALTPPAKPAPVPGGRAADAFGLPDLAEPGGGYWQFAGFPWVMELAGEPQPAPSDAARLLDRLAQDSPGGGVTLDPDQAESLRRLAWLGAVETPLPGGRTLWEITTGPTRVALALRRDGRGAVRVLGGTLTREDPAAQRWTTYSLLPREAPVPASEMLVPESASPTRIAARCDARGATILEIAEVSDRAFLGLPRDADEPESAGLLKFKQQAVAGRDVSYYRGPCARGRPVLVIASAGG